MNENNMTTFNSQKPYQSRQEAKLFKSETSNEYGPDYTRDAAADLRHTAGDDYI